MKALKIMIVMLVLIMSVGAVCAAENITSDIVSDDSQDILETVHEDITTDDSSDILETTQNDICTAGDYSFTNLTNEIEGKDVVNLTHDYAFNNETDNPKGNRIYKDNFVLNGNGHTIDGKNQSRLFFIDGNNVTLNDLILVNGNAETYAGIYLASTLTLNNVTFINNYATKQGGAIGLFGATLKCNNCRFIDNYADVGSSIFAMYSQTNIYDSYITSKMFNKVAQIFNENSMIYMENATFENISASYAPAIYLKASDASIINSSFINLKANISVGAIGTKTGGNLYIKNCRFTNTTSSKNAGAILADIYGDSGYNGTVIILDTVFNATSSGFAGAYLQFGGNLSMNNTVFVNDYATYNGGSVYISHVDGSFNNCTFDSNGVDLIEEYPTYGGAVFLDMSVINITGSKFFNNVASAGSAVYAYDTSYKIMDSTFENNTNPIYTLFDGESLIDETNIFINDNNISTNNTYFETFVFGQGLQLTLLNNTINVTELPSRFDLRELGWVSPVRHQGMMGACWTFGMTGVLEAALLRVANLTTDFSENNMQNTMLLYSIYGNIVSGIEHLYEGGVNLDSTGYLLSWLGAFTQDVDIYDEMGKISPLITTGEDIHVQDLMFTPNNDIPNGTQLKWAILKYGSIDMVYFGQSRFDEANPYYNETSYAQYVNESIAPNHAVSIVGWDDSFPKENFLITPPGDGAWIIKNSWGPYWGDNGYLYVSYYDKTLLRSIAIDEYGTSIIFENTEPYNKNYQYDIVWSGRFNSGNENVSYMNVFEAEEDDLIAAVGTYFNQSGINYTIEIYINDELKLTQKGVSPYLGYRTIKLDQYLPIKKGDVFKAKITSNAMPYTAFSETRVHYPENISFVSYDGQDWEDCYNSNMIACLKVYTVADDSKIINNEDIAVDYGSESYFTVQVVTADGRSVVAGAAVDFTINGKTTTAFTDADGIAKLAIADVPGTYDVTSAYNGQSYKNSVVVKLNPSTCKITQNKDINVDYDGGKYFSVKIVSADGKVAASGVSVKFTINGKSKTVTTDKDGIAKIKITDVPKKYIMATTYNGKSVKNTVTVKQVLKAKKVTVKKTAKKFTLKATLKINGKLVKGKVIKFKFNGKTYKVKTNKKGIAQKTLTKKVIKKLKKGKKYTVKVTYLKDTIKTTVKVK